MTRPDPPTALAYDRIITVATAVIASFQFICGTVCVAAFYSVTLTSIQQAALAICGVISFLLGFVFLYASIVFTYETQEDQD